MNNMPLAAVAHAVTGVLALAPGGDRDDVCAKAGIAAIQDSIDF